MHACARCSAYGYKDQPAIAAGLKALGKERKDVWITTKIPPDVFCKAADPAASVLELIQENLHQLNVSYVDLTLVHSPCDRASGKSSPLDLKAWKGMMEAVAKGWTRWECAVCGLKLHGPEAQLSIATLRVCKNTMRLQLVRNFLAGNSESLLGFPGTMSRWVDCFVTA